MQEQEAICQCQAGDLAALGVLFELHHQAVFRTAYGIVRNYDLAEDVTQEVFIELIKSIKRFDQTRPFRPWLHQIVVYRSLYRLKHHKVRDVTVEEIFELPSADLSPEEEAEQSELEAAVWNALGALAPKHRAVVVLRYYQGFSEAEMAVSLRCRRGTVKSRLHYALGRLRELLVEYTPSPSAPGLANPKLSGSRRAKTAELLNDAPCLDSTDVTILVEGL